MDERREFRQGNARDRRTLGRDRQRGEMMTMKAEARRFWRDVVNGRVQLALIPVAPIILLPFIIVGFVIVFPLWVAGRVRSSPAGGGSWGARPWGPRARGGGGRAGETKGRGRACHPAPRAPVRGRGEDARAPPPPRPQRPPRQAEEPTTDPPPPV